MRVLILHSKYRSGPASGENRVVEDEARLLTEAGHEVEIFAPTLGDPSAWGMLRAGMGAIWSRESVAEVRRRIDKRLPDIVHCHNLFPALSPAALTAIGNRAPLVLTLHNYRFRCLPGTLFRDRRVCEDCLKRLPWPGVLHGCYQGSHLASAALASSLVLHRAIGTYDQIRLYIAISDFVREKHLQSGFSPDQVIVKPHFAWRVEPREGPGDYFLYLGRLSAEKGVGELVELWRMVKAKLLIVGDGPEAPGLRAIAPENVEFPGIVQPDRIPAMLRGARALLVPSVWHEGAGKVVLEAYAAGVPVLVADAGALPEVVRDEVTGLVLPPTDTAAWVQGVERLLEDVESERMGRSARELWADRYSPERGLVNIEAAYRRAVG